MKHVLLILVLCFSVMGCGALNLDQRPIQPIEVQLLTKIAASQLLGVTEVDAKDLNALHAWTMRGEVLIAAVDPTHPEKLHEALITLSQDPNIPPEYADVTALLLVVLTSRVNIDMEASENMTRAINLSQAALTGLRMATEQRQNMISTARAVYWYDQRQI